MLTIVGIDPGLAGGVAVLSNHNVVLLEDLPVHAVNSGRRTRSELDLHALCDLLIRIPADHVVIEQVGARPGQGVTSMFRFGYVAGAIAGIVAALRLPYTMVTPQAWQKAAHVGPSPDMARQRACQLYPDIASRLARKKDGGRADALLIAHTWQEAHRAV